MEIEVKNFGELSTNELYDVLQLRSEVFVVEQDCVYQDIDGKDDRALHIMGWEDGNLVAYARCFEAGDYFDEASIGRILVRENYRKLGYGHVITKASIEAIKTKGTQNNQYLDSKGTKKPNKIPENKIGNEK